MNDPRKPDDKSLSSPRGLTRLDYALLALITLAALLLRAPQLSESLWVDELHTAWVVAGGLGELPSRAGIGNHSPVYFLLPWLSVQLLGLNEVALRLPSLLAGVTLIPAIYCLTHRLSSSRAAALVAAALAAIDPDFLYFAGEARMYACVQLVAVLQVGVFWSLVKESNWKWRAAFVALSALLFYLHYTAILLIVAEGVFLLAAAATTSNAPKYSLKAFACDGFGIGILMLPAARHLVEIAGRRENWTQFVHAPADLNAWQIFPFAAYLIAPLLIAYAFVLLRKFGGTARPLAELAPKAPAIFFCLCWLLVPLTIVYVTTATGIAALWMHRYVMASAPAVVVLAGLLCGLPTHKAARAGSAAVTLIIALWFVGPFWDLWEGTLGQWRDEDWRGAIALINADNDAGDWPILLRPALIEADALSSSDDPLLREYCLLPIRSIYAVDDSRLAVPLASSRPDLIKASDLGEMRQKSGAWIITRGGRENAEATFKQVVRTLSRAGLRSRNTNTQRFGTVWVMRVEFAERF